MKIDEMYRKLKGTDIPTAHNIFLNTQKPPYMIYRTDDIDIKTANSKVVLQKQRISIELYTKPGEVANNETKVETVLNCFTTYTKSRTFTDAEQLYVTYYDFYII